MLDGTEQRVHSGQGVRGVGDAPAVEVHVARGAVQHVEPLLRDARDRPGHERTCRPTDRHGTGLQRRRQVERRHAAVPRLAVHRQLSRRRT